jgi:hypothetical protein
MEWSRSPAPALAHGGAWQQHSLQQQQESGAGWFDSSGSLPPPEASRAPFSHFSIDGVSIGTPHIVPAGGIKPLPAAGVPVLRENRLNLQEHVVFLWRMRG